MATTATNGRHATEHIGDPTNGAGGLIALSEPYIATLEIRGTAALLFHAWNNESVAEKAGAKKGSTTKKTDDLESYVYRLPNQELALPNEYLRQSIIWAAKYLQDPRSPRKSAMDLFKAGLAGGEELCSLGQVDWDYLDRRRAVVQRNAVTRVRPAFAPGWRAEVSFLALTPEYISPEMLYEAAIQAGRLVGVGDFRPTFGRFQVVRYETNRA